MPDRSGGDMTDADRVRDSLESLKHMTEMYNQWALECTNPGVRDLLLRLHGEEQHNAGVHFSFLHNRDQYRVDTAPTEQLAAVRRRYEGLKAGIGPWENGRAVAPEAQPTP